MSYDREKLAWAAGFFDGEGSFYAAKNPICKDGRQATSPRCSITQAGEEGKKVLQRFKKAIGRLGNIYGPVKRGPYYAWRANTFEKTQAVAALLWKWLSCPKRKQVKTVLDRYHKGRR